MHTILSSDWFNLSSDRQSDRRRNQAAYLQHGFHGGGSQDIGTRDDARARCLGRCLDGVDDPEHVQSSAFDLVLLRQVQHRGVEQKRPVASLDEAVVEEQPEQKCRREGVLRHSERHLVTYYLTKRGAGLRVEVVIQERPRVRIRSRWSTRQGRWRCWQRRSRLQQVAPAPTEGAPLRGCQLQLHCQRHQATERTNNSHRLHHHGSRGSTSTPIWRIKLD